MAYSESPFSSTSSSYRRRWNYDVFLSFRREDTRRQFTDHLYYALIQAGIHTFRDNELSRGEEISPQLLRTIEGSRISVVVFSRNYASSRWCLDELVKIIECRQKIDQVVLPIFYDTAPSDVRKQTGSYAKAFDKHEKHFKEEMEKVNRWREALAEAANLSGWDLNNDTKGYEAKLIETIVNVVASKLGKKTRIEMTRPKSGRTDAISASEQEQNNVDMAQQREPEFTGEFELANDLIGGGIELPCDSTDDQDELKKLEGSKSRDMVDDLKSGRTDAISASEQEQNNVDMAQQREPESTGEFELAIDLTGAGIELPCDTPDELKKLKGSKYRDMVDFLKSGWTLLLTNLILEITSAVDYFKSGWTSLMTNLIIEIASAVFDQLGYAFVGMVLAFVALLLATADLIHMERMTFVALLLSTAERMNLLPRKERTSLLPISHRQSASTFAPWKPAGTIVEYFGLVGAVWQCVHSTVAYAYARQKRDNPIKMCLLPSIFLSCVVISKLIKKESH